MLSRATKRLAGGGSRPTPPPFGCARLVSQTARYRWQRDAWQVGAAAPTPPLFAAFGLSCRRLAIAGNELLGGCGLPPPHPRFPLRSACLADDPLPRATKCLAGGGCRAHTPAFRCIRVVLQAFRYRGQRSAWRVGAAAPTPPLSAALGSCRRPAIAGNDTGWGLSPPKPPLSAAPPKSSMLVHEII
jgi:hypothetical protein